MTTEGNNVPEEMECPYCGQYGPLNDTTTVILGHRMFQLENHYGIVIGSMLYYACQSPRCRQLTVTASLDRATIQGPAASNSHAWLASNKAIFSQRLLPSSRAKPFPEFVPQQIRDDYTEACSIEVLSPKASATMARRAVQGIIRDFFGITRRTLKQEIDELQSAVQPEVWAAIDALRQMGNIGAHPEHDINMIVEVVPGEARSLLNLIEVLLNETYVARERRKEQLARVVAAASEKAQETKPAADA